MNIWSSHGFAVEEKKIHKHKWLINENMTFCKWWTKKQHNFQICDGERNLCAGSLKICQTSPSKLARWAFILPCIVQCSHARSSWVVYICWMFIDNCVFDINLLQDATFVCVVSEIHVSRPPAPWEEHKNSKEYQFIK